MEILNRINTIYENLRQTLKSKVTADRPLILKEDIQSIQAELASLSKDNQENYARSLAMEGYLTLISVKTIPMSVTEKKNTLHAVYEKLKPFALRCECLSILLKIQNLLCYYLIQLENLSEARKILESTEELYASISSTNNKYLDAEDLFKSLPTVDIKGVDPVKIDKVITNNIQMQAYLYNKFNLTDKYTLYSHTVLRRQLEMKEGTPHDWAQRTSRLGNYFTYLNQLDEARYHLCAAYHILKTCHDNFKLIPDEFLIHKTDFEMNYLELSHYWVKYGLSLLKLSKKNILKRHFAQTSKPNLWNIVDESSHESFDFEKGDEENIKDFKVKITKSKSSSRNPELQFVFPTLDLKEVESKTPSGPINTEEEARTVFTFTYKWLMRAKHYYDFERHAAQYISCSLQQAELYEHLAFFERSLENQYRLQRKRSNVLEGLNTVLKTCDNAMSVQIDIIKELSQVQLELMALNLQKLWQDETVTNVFNLDNDVDSIINFMASDSNKTLTDKTNKANCRNMYLKKMEAATAMNDKLLRLSDQLCAHTPSELTFDSNIFKH